MQFDGYQTDSFYDEMITADGSPRRAAALLHERIVNMPDAAFLQRQDAAERALYSTGITFNVYGNEQAMEKVWPFDIVPRVIAYAEWQEIESGLKQRITAINRFIADVYGEQAIVREGIFPESVLHTASGYSPVCHGFKPPHDIWCHITGSDLVRDQDGTMYVLEDNLRVPSGVSYVLTNRNLMKRTFPEVFSRCSVMPVANYPAELLRALQHIAPAYRQGRPVVAVLTPGVYNSAYFEHSYLAQQLGAELVEGRDLIVRDDVVFMRTTRGLQRVDVIYRRVSDEFLDPEVFRPDSTLGVPGLMRAYQAGNVALANAPGTGVADDKVVYAFVPEMIRFYLGEEPILKNVPTRLCYRDEDLAYTLEHLEELVVKPANESGGYGMLVGPASTAAERSAFADLIRKSPRNYVSQPTLSISRAPVIVDKHFEGRHVDLRPFVVLGKDVYVMPGGLTRVALRKGSLVVNSSQGGGSKDTWVVRDAQPGERPGC